jgi:hypothetical protein
MVQMASVVFAPGGHVLAWGWFSIELANLLIILAMVVLFVVALLVPFGRAPVDAPVGRGPGDDADPDGDRS